MVGSGAAPPLITVGGQQGKDYGILQKHLQCRKLHFEGKKPKKTDSVFSNLTPCDWYQVATWL